MDIEEIKKLKEEVASINPSEIVDSSKKVSEHLSTSIENHKRTHDFVVGIADKVARIKKGLEEEIEELLIKRSEVIADGMKEFNDRNDKIHLLDKEISKRNDEIGSLENQKVETSAKISSTEKHLESLVADKNQMVHDITEFEGYVRSLKIQEQEAKNSIASFNKKKDDASRELVEIQSQVDEAKRVLQGKNNEILIANERLASLNK
jgi:chromosome segregation ATPase